MADGSLKVLKAHAAGVAPPHRNQVSGLLDGPDKMDDRRMMKESPMRNVTHALTRLLGGMTVAAALWLAQAAPAQSADGFSEIFQKDFSKRDLPILANALQLDDSQKLIIETLFDQYAQSIEDGINSLKDGWLSNKEQFDKLNPEDIQKVIFGAVEDWAARKVQLREQLITDIRDQVLTAQQQEQWPSVLRQLTRVKSLGKGRISGENIDLFIVMKDVGVELADSPQIEMLMMQYEISFDQALQARDKAIDASRRLRNDAMQTKDSTEYLAAIDHLVDARIAVRNVNEQYAMLVAASLPGDIGYRFTQEVRERSYPRVYRPTQMHRLIKAALEMPSLDASTQTALIELQAAYDAELSGLNEAMVAIIKQSDSQQEKAKAEQQMARMTGSRAPKPEDPIREEFRKREQLNQRYMELLQNLLTLEQWAGLPGASEAGDMPLKSAETLAQPTGTLTTPAVPDAGGGRRRGGSGAVRDGTDR
jgi:hypothetical protein